METYVDSCPQNITEVLESSVRLGCGQDKYGNDQYLCVPNTDKTGLIELCYNGTMGLIKRGNCLETDGENLYWNNCLGFLSGCPEKEYRSNEIYQYSACQSINTQYNCYLAESSCPNITWNIATSNTTQNLESTTSSPETSSNVAEILCGLAAFLLILAVIFTLAIVFWRRKKSQKNGTHELLNIPMNNVMSNKDKREEFLNDLKKAGESLNSTKQTRNSVDHVTWLWIYSDYARPDIVRSCIGLHPHNDIYIIDNKPYRKPSKYHGYQPEVRCLLYCLLLTEKYQLNLNEQSHEIIRNKIRERYFPTVTSESSLDIPQEVTETRDGVITFILDDIRHDVMYAFVTECLVGDDDLEFFLTTASQDVISEYCRSWDYKRSEGERCLYVPSSPEKMYDLFIDKLQLYIITHSTMSDRGIHNRISQRLNIPEEVLRWDIHGRERFVKNSKLGSVQIFRARGMIVGCTGAGKTSLLRKLHGRERTDKDKPPETTIGLEVHEDLFAIKENKLTGFRNANNSTNPYLDNNVISMTDFAGQVAYYACHQVYLSRRAFYIVVIDVSKNLDEESRWYDTDRHDPTGSLFQSWTYREYFQFWLQTINTYCNDGITQSDPKDTAAIRDSRANVNLHPVILIASHKDQMVGNFNTSETFYSQLEACLSKEQTLKRLISPYRYFEVECPPEALTQKQQMTIDRVKKCIVETVTNLPHWGEEVPLKWFELEKILNNEKANGKKIIKRSQLKETAKHFSIDEDDRKDVLHFLHEIGKILYFSVDKLKDTIIIDVQWFVDAFKYIITRPGLGLMAIGNKSHYVPCMNRKEIENAIPDLIQRSNSKTSVLIYRFSFLPFFLFFRLVVCCMQLKDWRVLITEGTSCLYRNAALFSVKHYNIVLSVTETSMQLQILHPVPGCSLEKEKTYKIQKIIEAFHTSLLYERSFKCREDGEQVMSVEYEGQFVQDKYICEKDGDIICPLHPIKDQHFINTTEISEFLNIIKP
ncbi:uncharacterized protein LOC134256001 [Saccostrea cucullata]|uniref:uncharacterized protein LOC134256001 n=1 Tax=Saccostrea cuccullata TaxID=36930 RepID=UPI002ED2E734